MAGNSSIAKAYKKAASADARFSKYMPGNDLQELRKWTLNLANTDRIPEAQQYKDLWKKYDSGQYSGFAPKTQAPINLITDSNYGSTAIADNYRGAIAKEFQTYISQQDNLKLKAVQDAAAARKKAEADRLAAEQVAKTKAEKDAAYAAPADVNAPVNARRRQIVTAVGTNRSGGTNPVAANPQDSAAVLLKLLLGQ